MRRGREQENDERERAGSEDRERGERGVREGGGKKGSEGKKR